MTSLPKTKGPASAATDPDRGSNHPLKGKIMNAHTSTTAPAAPTTGKDFQSRLEDLVGNLITLQHQLYLVNGELDRGFDLRRGKRDGSTVTLMFQENGIDALLWLSGEAWSKMVDRVAEGEALLRDVARASK